MENKEIKKSKETGGGEYSTDCFVKYQEKNSFLISVWIWCRGVFWWLFCFVTFCGVITAKTVSVRTEVTDRCPVHLKI